MKQWTKVIQSANNKIKKRIKDIFDRGLSKEDQQVFIENNCTEETIQQQIDILNEHYNTEYEYLYEFFDNDEIYDDNFFDRILINVLFDEAYFYFEMQIEDEIIPNTNILRRKVTSDYNPEEYINHIEPLGIYWSISNPETHWGKDQKYVYEFEAQISKDNIDLEETMVARCQGYIGQDEDEITLKKGTKVKLTEIYCMLNGTSQRVEIKNRNQYINKMYTI